MIEIAPVTHDLGDFKVRRVLPAKTRTMVGPFIFVDQFGPARLDPGKGMDVRPHPHINLATVTYLFDGAIRHRDSVGSDQVIRPGAINLMTAGIGHRPFRALARRRARRRPILLRHADLARAARRQGGDRPGVRACRPRRVAAGRGRRRHRPGADGQLVGRDRRRHPACPDHLRRHRARPRRQPRRSTPKPTSAR